MSAAIQEIRKALEAVKVEPWKIDKPTETLHAVRKGWGGIVADVGFGDTFEANDATCAYIAAVNPANITNLLDELAALRMDAGRYRRLRNHRGQEHDLFCVTDTCSDEVLWGGDLDAALDTQRAKEE